MDVLDKQKMPLNDNHSQAIPVLHSMLATCTNIQSLIMDQEAKEGGIQMFDHWFKILEALKNKVILNPYIQIDKATQQTAFSLYMNQILSYPFAEKMAPQDKDRTSKLFTELVFGMSYERICVEYGKLKKCKEGDLEWMNVLTVQWADELEGFSNLCCLIVNSITDIFIQFASVLSVN